eukprot:jgi/Botrbrau1/5258/Bobra.0172s0117.1
MKAHGCHKHILLALLTWAWLLDGNVSPVEASTLDNIGTVSGQVPSGSSWQQGRGSEGYETDFPDPQLGPPERAQSGRGGVASSGNEPGWNGVASSGNNTGRPGGATLGSGPGGDNVASSGNVALSGTEPGNASEGRTAPIEVVPSQQAAKSGSAAAFVGPRSVPWWGSVS